MFSVVVVVLVVVPAVFCCGECPQIVSRVEWNAREPIARQNMTTPVGSVIIHHTYIPGACRSVGECENAMRAMQNFHMDTRGWFDIGYSFAIGGDCVYEGRGWRTQGAHAPGYNNRSIGIVFIGDYREQLPTETMLNACIGLIQYGIDNKYIQPDYQLLGHRQVRDTECPGDALYQLIQTWSHWRSTPFLKVT